MNQDHKARIGILSTAEIAHKVCLAIKNSSNAVVAAVASRSLEKAQAWAKERDIPVAYGTYDELLNDANVDAIYIPLPTSLKKTWAIQAAQKGKHILLEKPLPGADSDQDILDIVQACKENSVQFLDGTMWLHSLRTKDLAARKATIGQVRIVNAAFTFKAPNEEWLQGGNGRTNKNQEPQGCLGDQGWYPVGAILFAYDYELPKIVRAIHWKKNKVDTIIQLSGFLEFANDRIAYFDVGVTAPHRCYFEAVGEKGVIRVDDQVGGQGRTGNFDAYFLNFVGSDRYFIDDEKGKETVIQTQASNHTVLMIEQFASLILSKKVDEQWPHRSVQTHRVLAGLFRSVEQNGAAVKLD